MFPTDWFDDRKEVKISVPFLQANEKQSRKFLQSMQSFTRAIVDSKLYGKQKRDVVFQRQRQTQPPIARYKP